MTPSNEQRVLTANDCDIIRERHFGWEKATPGLLADVFRVPVQRINAVLRPIDPAKLA